MILVSPIKLEGHIDETTAHLPDKLLSSTSSPVTLTIDSPGGAVHVGLEIIAAINRLKARDVVVQCVVTGSAMSMALYIFDACSERYALPHAVVMWHPTRVRLQGAYSKVELAGLVTQMQMFESQLDDVLLHNLRIDPELYYFHYNAETEIPATILLQWAPHYLIIVDDVRGE